jgi:hypothetical protein
MDIGSINNSQECMNHDGVEIQVTIGQYDNLNLHICHYSTFGDANFRYFVNPHDLLELSEKLLEVAKKYAK